MATSQIQLDPKQRQRLAQLDETIACLDRGLRKAGSMVSWTRDALAAIKRIILIEDRIAALSGTNGSP
ncbi:MAG TPA: hypothetical protein VK514_02690 [Candidatus Acidoferrum sp.]|nr:hypothetical protein [Candidatus Acidoferrum sp.]